MAHKKMPLADDRDPWERQPEESALAYSAFQDYLDMGPSRTVVRVKNEKTQYAPTTVHSWSAKHSWAERAAAWDSIPRKALAEEFEAMARRVAEQHEGLATALMKKLRQNVDLLKPGKDPTMSFSTALGAARQSHQFAVDLGRPKDPARDEIARKIADTFARLTADDEGAE